MEQRKKIEQISKNECAAAALFGHKGFYRIETLAFPPNSKVVSIEWQP